MASDKLYQNVVSALCKHFSADSNEYLGDDVASDLKSTCEKILKSSGDGDALQNNDAELAKWVTFAESLPAESALASKVLSSLNEDLIKKAVILGPGLKPSAADVIVFAAVHPVVVGLPDSDTVKLPHLMRWMDYIQIKVGLQDLFTPIVLEKSQFKPPVVKANVKADSKEKKAVATKESSTDKKKANEKETSGKDVDVSVSLLKIQIGLVRKASQHPSADSLLVEEIDIGESKNRQVVSGLAKHIPPEQLTNRYVVLITNVKPSKLRDILSEGLVLCASNQDHSVVEPLIVPEGAKIGECVTFSGFEGEPEAVLNPKKKQLEKITPHLATDGSGIAMFKGVPFMTSAGPCKSSIPNGSVK